MNQLNNSVRFIPLCVLALYTDTYATPPPGHPSPDDAATLMKIPQAESFPHSGRVIVAINSNSYTYIHVKVSEQAVWLAAPRIDLVKGQRIAFPDGSLMRNFYSRKLKRTFPGIIFVRRVEILPEET